MTERKLMEALAAAARVEKADRESIERLWQALERGILSPGQREEIERLTDLAPETLDELAAPLDKSFRVDVADRLWDELNRESDQPAATETNVVTLRPWKKPALLALTSLAATAVLTVGVFGLLRESIVATLPGYELSLVGGSTELRGDTPPAGRAEFAAGNFFDLQLTPDEAIANGLQLDMALYTYQTGKLSVLAAPPAAITEKGVVRIEGEVGADVVFPEGESMLIVVLAGRGALPGKTGLQRLVSADQALSGKGWQGWRIPVSVR